MDDHTQTFIEPKFKTARPESFKYKYFIFVDIEGNGSELDTSILEDHHITDGALYLQFKGNEFVIHKMWRTIDYGYNKPQ